MKNLKLLIVAVVVGLAILTYWVVNHSGFFPYGHNPMQYMPNMHRTAAIRIQEGYSFFKDGAGGRVPPAGTVARSGLTGAPYTIPAEVLAADAPRMENPFPRSREVVMRGKQMYETFCIVCHGPAGMGDGFVIPKFPKPPVLVSEKLVGFADSQIYHIITRGQNSMMSYAKQVREEDRWKIIHYIRVLQRAYNPTSEDLQKFKDITGGAK